MDAGVLEHSLSFAGAAAGIGAASDVAQPDCTGASRWPWSTAPESDGADLTHREALAAAGGQCTVGHLGMSWAEMSSPPC